MKTFISTSLLLSAAAATQADAVKYVNSDGSAFGEICIAAL